MIHFPKPKFAAPQFRRATRSKAQRLKAEAQKRSFLAEQRRKAAADAQPQPDTIEAALALLSDELKRRTGMGLLDEQRECLLDPERYDEAMDMLDDMEARMGITSHVRSEVADALTQRDFGEIAKAYTGAADVGTGAVVVVPTAALTPEQREKAQQTEAADLRQQRREEERDYFERQGDEGTDSMIAAIEANGGRFTI